MTVVAMSQGELTRYDTPFRFSRGEPCFGATIEPQHGFKIRKTAQPKANLRRAITIARLIGDVGGKQP